MNKTFLVAASLRLRYSPPVLGFLDQKYTITFVNSLEGLEDIEETDDRIYGIQGAHSTLLYMRKFRKHQRSLAIAFARFL